MSKGITLLVLAALIGFAAGRQKRAALPIKGSPDPAEDALGHDPVARELGEVAIESKVAGQRTLGGFAGTDLGNNSERVVAVLNGRTAQPAGFTVLGN